jgi:hypothetical protein
MDAAFTIPYSEYAVIEHLSGLLKSDLLKKGVKKGDPDYCYYSSYIPTSRQQEGVDFLICNSRTKNCLRFQVKSSRSYNSKTPDKKGQYKYNLWFKNFIKSYYQDKADFYILFALYPSYSPDKSIHSKRFWENIILCFSDAEMKVFLDSVLTKKEKNPDSFFGISFDEPEKIFGNRGFQSSTDFSQYLLIKQLDAILQAMT